eukprot:325895-Prorocentrum_minimum.AAC.2
MLCSSCFRDSSERGGLPARRVNAGLETGTERKSKGVDVTCKWKTFFRERASYSQDYIQIAGQSA